MFLNTDIRRIDTLEITECAIKTDRSEKLTTQGTQDKKNKTNTKHTMCWTPLYANENK